VHLRKCIYWEIGYPLKKEQRILSRETRGKGQRYGIFQELLPVDIEI